MLKITKQIIALNFMEYYELIKVLKIVYKTPNILKYRGSQGI